MKTRLTVAVPVYNAEKYIEQCISSIQQQSLKNINIIVVDDGSTDSSFKLCQDMAASDSRITLIHQENQGCIAAREKAVEICTTEYITFVDADDFILEDSYINAVPYMNDHIDMISFNIARYYVNNKIKVEDLVPNAGYYNLEKIKGLYYKLIWNFEKVRPGIDPSLCTKIVKTDLYKQVYNNIGSTTLMMGQDTATFCELFLNISRLQVIDNCYYMHRQRPNNIVAPYIKNDDYFDQIAELHDRLLKLTANCNEKYMLQKQIDYMIINLAKLKKQVYSDSYNDVFFLFPFDKVNSNAKIVLYGAGNVGRKYYSELIKTGYCSNVFWVDKNANNILDDRVHEIEEIFVSNYDYYVIAIDNKEISSQVKDWLVSRNIPCKKIITDINVV